MSQCPICDELNSNKLTLYKGDGCTAILAKDAAVPGHALVVPNEHYPIIEMIPDFVLAEMVGIANKLSIALFEGLKAQGTNIMIMNGPPAGQNLPHCVLEVIPRKEGDGLDMNWAPKQVSEDELVRIEETLKAEAKNIQPFEKTKKEPMVEEKKVTAKVVEDTGDLRIRHLRRIP